mmetsp:Transcript_4100/g.9284  ORF Transcript_4100/g.9284 Transcript_4100/m.9284 type:complete len:84 (+) Transcript_4100:192-443(+)
MLTQVVPARSKSPDRLERSQARSRKHSSILKRLFNQLKLQAKLEGHFQNILKSEFQTKYVSCEQSKINSEILSFLDYVTAKLV